MESKSQAGSPGRQDSGSCSRQHSGGGGDLRAGAPRLVLRAGRDDNILLLPGCALVGGWLLASAAKLLVVELLSGVAGAALYRFVTIGRRHLAQRFERRAVSALAA